VVRLYLPLGVVRIQRERAQLHLFRGPQLLRLLSANVRHGRGAGGRSRQHCFLSLDAIDQIEVNEFGLLEVEPCVPRVL
jgi:hypothetical protein